MIEWLLARKGAQTHRAFAARLGITESQWSRQRHGQMRLTDAYLGRIVRVFPTDCVEILALWDGQRAARKETA